MELHGQRMAFDEHAGSPSHPERLQLGKEHRERLSRATSVRVRSFRIWFEL